MKQQMYSLVFLFDDGGEEVVLVRKKRPDWQKGQLNGVGGHAEGNETPHDTASREFLEEAGVLIPTDELVLFNSMFFPYAIVHSFCVFNSDYVYRCKTRTDEEIGSYVVRGILSSNFKDYKPVMYNVPNLIKDALWWRKCPLTPIE